MVGGSTREGFQEREVRGWGVGNGDMLEITDHWEEGEWEDEVSEGEKI